MIVADTDVVSELMRDDPDPAVVAWAEALDQAAVTISVITVEEIERGLGRLPAGRRRRDLGRRWQLLLDSYSDAVLVYDVPAAQATSALLVRRERVGRPMTLADAQIAGTCLAHRASLATRNVAEFTGTPHLTLVNPFS